MAGCALRSSSRTVKSPQRRSHSFIQQREVALKGVWRAKRASPEAPPAGGRRFERSRCPPFLIRLSREYIMRTTSLRLVADEITMAVHDSCPLRETLRERSSCCTEHQRSSSITHANHLGSQPAQSICRELIKSAVSCLRSDRLGAGKKRKRARC